MSFAKRTLAESFARGFALFQNSQRGFAGSNETEGHHWMNMLLQPALARDLSCMPMAASMDTDYCSKSLPWNRYGHT